MKKLNKELESLKQKKKGKNNDAVIKTLESEISNLKKQNSSLQGEIDILKKEIENM